MLPVLFCLVLRGKGASLQPNLLRNLVTKDVHFGYCPPLPLGEARNTPEILLALMNIQKKNTINEHGRIIKKDCLTHDQSFKWSSGTSVNTQTQANKLLGANSPMSRYLLQNSTSNQLSDNVISTQPRQSKLAHNLLKSAFSS
jgi:hypothetical protein